MLQRAVTGYLLHPPSTAVPMIMWCRYVGKLRTELEDSAWRYFHGPAERERIRSVLVDLSQTALAFTQITHKALEQLSSGVAPRLR